MAPAPTDGDDPDTYTTGSSTAEGASRASECSVITIGKAMLKRCNYDPDELLRRVRYATEQAAGRWG